MGKSKNKKFKSPKPQPTGLPSVRDCDVNEELENVTHTPSTVQSLIEKLGSACEEERECGCAGIASLVSQPDAIPAFMGQNIIRILSPLVLDHSLQVRHRALGALRNLSVDGGIEVCEEMVKQDALTALVALCKQFEPGWTPEHSTKKKPGDIKCEIFIELTHILLNLCESCQAAVDVFDRENLVNHLWPCLQYNIYGSQVAVAAAQCLHTVTDNNETLATVCRQDKYMSILHGVLSVDPVSTDFVLLKILSTGILVNIGGAHVASAAGNIITDIFATVASVLDCNAFDHVKSALPSAEQTEDKEMAADTGASSSETDQDFLEEPKDKIDDIKSILTAQKVAIEIVTNLCCSDDDDDWEDEEGNSESSTDEGAVAADADDQMDSIYANVCLPTEVNHAIVSNKIFEKVLAKAEPFQGIDLLPFSKNGKMVLQRLVKQQTIMALFCVNNLVSSLDPTALGGADNLHTILKGLVTLAGNQSTSLGNGQFQADLLEAVTSAMRAVVQKLADLNSDKIKSVTPEEVQFLCTLGTQCTCPEIRINVIRTISTIACVMAKMLPPSEMLKELGAFFLQVVTSEADLWVVAETLDAIFDVFGEDHLNRILQDLQMIQKLQQLIPVLKSKLMFTDLNLLRAQMKNGKRTLGEHFPIISTARTNLIRFVKYKLSVM